METTVAGNLGRFPPGHCRTGAHADAPRSSMVGSLSQGMPFTSLPLWRLARRFLLPTTWLTSAAGRRFSTYVWRLPTLTSQSWDNGRVRSVIEAVFGRSQPRRPDRGQSGSGDGQDPHGGVCGRGELPWVADRRLAWPPDHDRWRHVGRLDQLDRQAVGPGDLATGQLDGGGCGHGDLLGSSRPWGALPTRTRAA